MTSTDHSALSPLGRHWIAIANSLGLRILAPASVVLESGSQLNADAILLDIGGPKGMLLVTDFEIVRTHSKEIEEAGYGFSVLQDPGSSPDSIPPAEELFEVLRDWGWSGAPEHEPSWMRNA